MKRNRSSDINVLCEAQQVLVIVRVWDANKSTIISDKHYRCADVLEDASSSPSNSGKAQLTPPSSTWSSAANTASLNFDPFRSKVRKTMKEAMIAE